MLEVSESAKPEGLSSETNPGTSPTACKKVRCGGGPLDSAELWSRNDKPLCPIRFLEANEEGRCAKICFINLEQCDVTQKDEEWTKALASISPSLPQLILSENIQHLQENEVMLLSNLPTPSTCPSSSASLQCQPPTSVCLFRCAGGRHSDGVAPQINRFLTGLAPGREQQRYGNPPGRQAEEDAELSASSVDDDFLSTSEHLGEYNEGDPLQADVGSGNITDPLQSRTGSLEPSNNQEPCHGTPREDNACVEDPGAMPCSMTPDLLVPSPSQMTLPTNQQEVASCSPSHSFKLPKIIIMQSTDSDDGIGDQPGSPTPKVNPQDAPGEGAVLRSSCPCPDLPPLVCAATVTSTYPWLQGPISPLLKMKGERQDFSLFSALCGVAQVAGAVALADLAKADETASAEAFRANIVRVLLGEASAILCRRDDGRSFVDLLRAGSGVILGPDVACSGRRKMDHFTHTVAESIWEQAAKRAAVKKKPESPGGDVGEVPLVQDALLESVNAILFDVLCITAKKISDISIHNIGPLVRQETEIQPGDQGASEKSSKEPLNQLLQMSESRMADTEGQSGVSPCTDALSAFSETKEETTLEEGQEEEESTEMPSAQCLLKGKDLLGASQSNGESSSVRGCSDLPEQAGRGNTADPKVNLEGEKTTPCSDPKTCPLVRERTLPVSENRPSLLTPQFTPSSPQNGHKMATKCVAQEALASPVSGFADDLAATVVSMATELAAIYLENSSGKQPWFCGLKGAVGKAPQRLLLPCRSMTGRRKEVQSDYNGISVVAKKHRPPRLSEIKRKAEEQPELMERLVNRVVDETVIPDEPPDTTLASQVSAKAVTCPELSVVDTSTEDEPQSRLGCENLGWGKVASQGSNPEEEDGPPIALGPAARLGQDLSRGGSISKQSSCESITDEFSKFMVHQMESEGRGFDLLLDYYAGKSAGSILSAAMQQVAGKRSNGHLSVRSACISKQSSTESITEEFYRFMLRDLDRDGRDRGVARAKEWSNTLLPPSPRSHFCIRQSSMPDRRSSDSRLTVNTPVKANSFDDFGRSSHRDTLDVYPPRPSSGMGLCRSDSCLYQRGQMDRITDALIHDTWRGSIESLMRKNKIIGDEPEDAEGPGERRPHVELYANRLVADILESGKSSLGSRRPASVGERRRCFRTKAEFDWSGWGQGGDSTPPLGSRDVPQIHIQEDHREQPDENSRSPEESTNSPLQTSSESWGLSDSGKDGLEGGEAGGNGRQMEWLVMNFDLGGQCLDWNLQATLQWIAATELGLPAVYFQKSPGRTGKLQDVVQLVSQRGWTVGNLFCAVMQFCEIKEERAEFLDWLLERLHP